MFQIEPILWLQSFESPILTTLMATVSSLGYSVVYGTLIIVLVFGFNFKKGLFLFLLMFIGGILTHGLKSGLKLPRPSDIDIRINEPNRAASQKLVEMGGADSFWSLPSSGAMAAVKIQNDWSYGFPSGHVSAAAVFFLGLFFFFRKKGMLLFALSWVLLMALSRMYLGRHFVADVLGGIVVAGVAILIGFFLLRPLKMEDSKAPNGKAFLRLTGFALTLVFLTPFIEILDADNIGRLAGIIVAYYFTTKIALSSDQGTIWQRLGRILVAVIMFFVTNQLISNIMDSMAWEDIRWLSLIASFLIISLPFIAAFTISSRLNLYIVEER